MLAVMQRYQNDYVLHTMKDKYVHIVVSSVYVGLDNVETTSSLALPAQSCGYEL